MEGRGTSMTALLETRSITRTLILAGPLEIDVLQTRVGEVRAGEFRAYEAGASQICIGKVGFFDDGVIEIRAF